MQHLIVFDLDGTLVDSQRDLADSANELLRTLGAPPLSIESVGRMVGDGARVLVERVLAEAGLDASRSAALDQFLAIYDTRVTNHTAFYPGLLDMIEWLRRDAEVSLAIVTNKPERHTRALLGHFGVLDAFSWIVGGDSGIPKKPSPDGILHVMTEWLRRIGETGSRMSPGPGSRVLFVGDSMVDLETGRNAGVRVCLAAYGFGHLRGDLLLDGTELVANHESQLHTLIRGFLSEPEGA
jgi:phosphoglycolate phosphatase